MALVLADRVRDTTTTTGTGAVTLSGSPPSGYQAFSKVGDGNTTYYTISGGGQWEVGIGTYTASSTSLSRDTVLDSSNSGSLVNFSAGTKDVFVTYPAGESVYQDGSAIKAGTSYLGVANGGTGAATLTSNALLKGNGTSAISASSITDNGTLVSIANPVTFASPNRSAAAWTTSGINLIQSAATFTDTTSTGTVADVRINNFAAQTVAATNTITATNLYGTYFIDPVAGTNVTATARYALGADSLRVAGSVNIVGGTTISGTIDARGTLSFSPTTASTSYNIGGSTQTGTIQLGRSTVSQTVEVAQGITASGSTKTVNIGTNGASGSTTNITVGSATSGATQTTTINGRVTLAPIGASAAAWTTNGIGLIQSAATWTDTSSTGSIADIYVNKFNSATVAASNAVSTSFIYGTYFTNPVAGTNVTATTLMAVGADSLRVNGIFQIGSAGSITISGSVNLIGPTGPTTAAFATGVTTTGNTKTVNIGTGGASGSTTAITLGSSTSGATQTTTINGRVTLAPIGASAAAWTTSGIALTQSAATWTDTSSTGTVAAVRMNNFAAQTMAASNVITVTDLYNAYISNAAAGTNVTATRSWALAVDSLNVTNGRLWQAGSAFSIQGSSGSGSDLGAGITNGSLTVCSALTTGTFTLGSTGGTGAITLGQSTASQTTNIQAGVTASGSTKTVNIGTGGASGSTTNITIGSSTSGATSTTRLNGTTIIQQAAPVSFSVSGTLTGANMATGFIQFTGSNGQTLTTDTGTNLDTSLAAMAVDTAIDFSILNTGSVVSIAGGTGVTVVGRASVAANSAVLWRLRKTGTATYTLYQYAG